MSTLYIPSRENSVWELRCRRCLWGGFFWLRTAAAKWTFSSRLCLSYYFLWMFQRFSEIFHWKFFRNSEEKSHRSDWFLWAWEILKWAVELFCSGSSSTAEGIVLFYHQHDRFIMKCSNLYAFLQQACTCGFAKTSLRFCCERKTEQKWMQLLLRLYHKIVYQLNTASTVK